MNSGSFVTRPGGAPFSSKVKRGDIVEIDGKLFKILAVKSTSTVTVGPLNWWERALHRVVWFVRLMYQRICYWYWALNDIE